VGEAREEVKLALVRDLYHSNRPNRPEFRRYGGAGGLDANFSVLDTRPMRRT